MRKGKMVAQGAHAAIGALALADYDDVKKWEETGTTKICVYVKSEDELIALFGQASEADLAAYLVQDAGRTEFDGPTYTAVAIGPADASRIDLLTKALPLL